ncbi:MAG: hypothetical protein Q4E82_05010 [Peptococcaceae bacterium]|nr:hypothetical protein [Peptococcaceae bacterium]
MGTFIREKKTHCGKRHLEVDIYQLSDNHHRKKNRGKREKVSAPAQKNLNDKNARRYLRQLAKTNFDSGDLHVTCTYRNKFLPATMEEAEQEVTKYIRRLQYYCKKNGIGPLKYIIITEGQTKEESLIRVHHHIIMSGLDRDTVEELWRKPKKKGEKVGERIGFCNADRLQIDDDAGIDALMNYLSKRPTGKKRWRSSQNLKAPEVTVADKKWSKRKLMEAAGTFDDDRAFWAKKFPGWRMVHCKSAFNEISGWVITLELRRIE